jgi:hypothetical protein
MTRGAYTVSIYKTLQCILGFIQLAQNADVNFQHVILMHCSHFRIFTDSNLIQIRTLKIEVSPYII